MFCFVLMPFDPEFKDVYEIGIKEACESAGAYCQRVDEQIFHASILDQIYNQISKADVVIADMTGRNPNVFYEVGYAHALGKRTILLTKSADDIPFDLKHYPHIVYDGSITKLRKQLTTRVKWCIDNPIETTMAHTIDIEIYIGEINLSSGIFVFEGRETSKSMTSYITVHNNSSRTYVSEEYEIGMTLRENVYVPQSDLYEPQAQSQWCYRASLPSGGNLWALSPLGTLFPGQYDRYKLPLFRRVRSKENMILSVFTNAGSREWCLTWPGGKTD